MPQQKFYSRTSMEQIQRRRVVCSTLSQLWDSLIPEHIPAEHQFQLWLNRFDEDIVEESIQVTALKMNKGRMTDKPMDLNGLQAYATAVMRNKQQARNQNRGPESEASHA